MIWFLLSMGVFSIGMCLFMWRLEVRQQRGSMGLFRSSDLSGNHGYTERQVSRKSKTEKV
jgi:hypothetical protein